MVFGNGNMVRLIEGAIHLSNERIASEFEKLTGDIAFPIFVEHPDGNIVKPGMNLRDYFAGQVLAKFDTNATYETIAKTAYDIADEMIKLKFQSELNMIKTLQEKYKDVKK